MNWGSHQGGKLELTPGLLRCAMLAVMDIKKSAKNGEMVRPVCEGLVGGGADV